MVEDPFTANLRKNRVFGVYGHLGKLVFGVESNRFSAPRSGAVTVPSA
jgi:hypothetical protein